LTQNEDIAPGLHQDDLDDQNDEDPGDDDLDDDMMDKISSSPSIDDGRYMPALSAYPLVAWSRLA